MMFNLQLFVGHKVGWWWLPMFCQLGRLCYRRDEFYCRAVSQNQVAMKGPVKMAVEMAIGWMLYGLPHGL